MDISYYSRRKREKFRHYCKKFKLREGEPLSIIILEAARKADISKSAAIRLYEEQRQGSLGREYDVEKMEIRNAQIYTSVKLGEPVAKIAEKMHLSRDRIYGIIKKENRKIAWIAKVQDNLYGA